MAINDRRLQEIAKAVAGESFETSTHLGLSNTTITLVDTSATSFPGEFGTRIVLSATRDDTVVSFTGLRSSTAVLNNTTGDIITNIANFAASVTTDSIPFEQIITSGLTQTTNFDIQFTLELTIDRK